MGLVSRLCRLLPKHHSEARRAQLRGEPAEGELLLGRAGVAPRPPREVEHHAAHATPALLQRAAAGRRAWLGLGLGSGSGLGLGSGLGSGFGFGFGFGLGLG